MDKPVADAERDSLVQKAIETRLSPQDVQELIRFQYHMMNVDPEALAILKGHLFIEEAIDKIIEVSVHQPEHLKALGLRFYKKVVLARALVYQNEDAPVWDIILKLNELRNSLAHHLDIERREKCLQALKDTVTATMPQYVQNFAQVGGDRFITAIVIMCLARLDRIEAHAKHFHNVTLLAIQS